MSVPAFIDLPPADQALELREYLISIGAQISAENHEDLYDNVRDIVEAAEVLWKTRDVGEIEGVINSILSLLFVIPPTNCAPLIKSLCNQLVKAAEFGKAALSMRLLHNFFHGYDIKTPFLYDTYCAWVRVANSNNCIHLVPTDLKKVNAWLDLWECSTEQRHVVLRLLHEAQINCVKSDDAAKTMIQLLGDYTEDIASQAREDAHKCIVRELADPNTYLYDHLLTLKPVKFLEGEKIFDLLTIFISGRLKDYQKFEEENAEFLQSIDLDRDLCVRKMRLLTLIDVVTDKKEVDFSEIQSQLQLQEDELEEFIIDAIQSNLITGRIVQAHKKLVVSHTTQRTFGKHQWQALTDRLLEWKSNLSKTYSRLSSIDPM